MRLLDRYILKSVLAVFLGCFFAFIFLYVIADFISRLDDILKNHISFSLILSYYLHSLPVMLTQTTPWLWYWHPSTPLANLTAIMS